MHRKDTADNKSGQQIIIKENDGIQHDNERQRHNDFQRIAGGSLPKQFQRRTFLPAQRKRENRKEPQGQERQPKPRRRNGEKQAFDPPVGVRNADGQNIGRNKRQTETAYDDQDAAEQLPIPGGNNKHFPYVQGFAANRGLVPGFKENGDNQQPEQEKRDVNGRRRRTAEVRVFVPFGQAADIAQLRGKSQNGNQQSVSEAQKQKTPETVQKDADRQKTQLPERNADRIYGTVVQKFDIADAFQFCENLAAYFLHHVTFPLLPKRRVSISAAR